jgi:hypothetical protein
VEYKRYLDLYPVYDLFLNIRFAFYPMMHMAELRLFIKVRKQGSRIESVPLKQLVELSGQDKKSWSYKDGWLILETG